MAVRNMLTPCGMPTLDNKGPTRDRGPVQLYLLSNTRVLGRDGACSSDSWFLLTLVPSYFGHYLLSNTRVLGRDGACSSDSWFLLTLAITSYTAFLTCYLQRPALKQLLINVFNLRVFLYTMRSIS